MTKEQNQLVQPQNPPLSEPSDLTKNVSSFLFFICVMIKKLHLSDLRVFLG
jgi:hypothetical protein